MNEDEAFIRVIVDSPGDDTPRLVYADWLDDSGDPRGPYLRAEAQWEKGRQKPQERKVRKLAALLDAVWVYRVSRPPLGACFKNKVFEFTGPHITIEDIRAQESTIPFLPDEYVAFLMNYNGGLLLDRFYDDECMGFAQLGVSGMYTGWSSSNDKVTPLNLPTVQGLADELY